ncbi:MAG: hypothetical protein AMXMBFR66_30630 [Pseudomonadota bacterium]
MRAAAPSHGRRQRASVDGIAGGARDTPASRSRTSAQARIDARLFDFGLALAPAPGHDLRAELRRCETPNGMPGYLSCKPLTGQWVRLTNDGSGSSRWCATPPPATTLPACGSPPATPRGAASTPSRRSGWCRAQAA